MNILQQILEGPPLEATAFPANSRYRGVKTAQFVPAAGEPIVYLTRRFAPAADPSPAPVNIHRVSAEERLDNIAARYLGDPELYWRICDANAAMSPYKLTARPGTEIRIPAASGVPNA